MHYVILRDDDTSAVTPTHVLDTLYRPFLDRGLPVQLSVIPKVNTRATLPDGRPEWYLPNDPTALAETIAIGEHHELTAYLRANREFGIVQHGFEHTFQEFLATDDLRIRRSLYDGAKLLVDAGLGRPSTFVAPQDRISPSALRHLAERFRVVSTCWFERAQVAGAWWPPYLLKKALGRPHWRAGECAMLSHPGSLLTHTREPRAQLDALRRHVGNHRLTVVVTHWWEYFRREQYDPAMLGLLHETADWLASARDVRVVSFDDVARGLVPLH